MYTSNTVSIVDIWARFRVLSVNVCLPSGVHFKGKCITFNMF